jgi:hypothetical protein
MVKNFIKNLLFVIFSMIDNKSSIIIELLKAIYEEHVTHSKVEYDAQALGVQINQQLGLDWPWLDTTQSKYTLELYDETINLGLTYYKQ